MSTIVKAVCQHCQRVTTVPAEAIEIGLKAANDHYLDFMIDDDNAFDEAIKAGIRAALAALSAPEAEG